MISKNKYHILIWIIVILLATNLSVIFSSLYYKSDDMNAEVKTEELAIEMPAQQRTRFFREQLNLQPQQMDIFRDLNREYNRSARRISYQLEESRIEMVNEMGKNKPETEKLDTISENIGKLHSDLKRLTIQYYLDMKEICDKSQQKKLNEIFMSMSKSKEDVSLPQRGRKHRGRQSE